jgi:hypothetical protein
MTKGKLEIKQNKVRAIELPINAMRQGSQIVIYTPALDLCTSGDTRDQALENFHEAVQIFLEDLLEQGTFDEVLEELGWQLEEANWVPPAWECNHFESVNVPSHTI